MTTLTDGKPCTVYRCGGTWYTDDKLLDELAPETVCAVLAWIRENFLPRRTALHGVTSYGLKHRLQNRMGVYLSDNQFKHAMLRCGFEPVDPSAVSWEFRISKRSPVFTVRPRYPVSPYK